MASGLHGALEPVERETGVSAEDPTGRPRSLRKPERTAGSCLEAGGLHTDLNAAKRPGEGRARLPGLPRVRCRHRASQSCRIGTFLVSLRTEPLFLLFIYIVKLYL